MVRLAGALQTYGAGAEKREQNWQTALSSLRQGIAARLEMVVAIVIVLILIHSLKQTSLAQSVGAFLHSRQKQSHSQNKMGQKRHTEDNVDRFPC